MSDIQAEAQSAPMMQDRDAAKRVSSNCVIRNEAMELSTVNRCRLQFQHSGSRRKKVFEM